MVGVRNHDADTADTASPNQCVKLVACVNPNANQNPSLTLIDADVIHVYISIKNILESVNHDAHNLSPYRL